MFAFVCASTLLLPLTTASEAATFTTAVVNDREPLTRGEFQYGGTVFPQPSPNGSAYQGAVIVTPIREDAANLSAAQLAHRARLPTTALQWNHSMEVPLTWFGRAPVFVFINATGAPEGPLSQQLAPIHEVPLGNGTLYVAASKSGDTIVFWCMPDVCLLLSDFLAFILGKEVAYEAGLMHLLAEAMVRLHAVEAGLAGEMSPSAANASYVELQEARALLASSWNLRPIPDHVEVAVTILPEEIAASALAHARSVRTQFQGQLEAYEERIAKLETRIANAQSAYNRKEDAETARANQDISLRNLEIARTAFAASVVLGVTTALVSIVQLAWSIRKDWRESRSKGTTWPEPAPPELAPPPTATPPKESEPA